MELVQNLYCHFDNHSKQNLINLGHDIVANNVNDILVLGAKPITFMDYTGTNKLNSQDLQRIIQGISESCKKYNICLIAGETAEMSSVYRHDNNTEIIGCVTGLLENNKIINGLENIQKNDTLVGLPSTGPHTNGYTLIRKILDYCDESDIKLHK